MEAKAYECGDANVTQLPFAGSGANTDATPFHSESGVSISNATNVRHNIRLVNVESRQREVRQRLTKK